MIHAKSVAFLGITPAAGFPSKHVAFIGIIDISLTGHGRGANCTKVRGQETSAVVSGTNCVSIAGAENRAVVKNPNNCVD